MSNDYSSYSLIDYAALQDVKALAQKCSYAMELANTYFNSSGRFKPELQKQAIDLNTSLGAIVTDIQALQAKIKTPQPDYVEDKEQTSVSVVSDVLIQVVTKKITDFFKGKMLKITGTYNSQQKTFETYVEGAAQVTDSTLPEGTFRLNLIVWKNPDHVYSGEISTPLDINSWTNKKVFFTQ